MNDGSTSDIYYDEESNTVKNHKNEVIAYFDEGKWFTLPEAVGSTYCREITQIIEQQLNGSSENIQSLIIKLKRKISQINRQKKAKNLALKDAAIALDLNPEDLKSIQNQLIKVLKSNHVKYTRIKNPHVSTAYLLGYNRFADLANLVDTISNYSYEFKVTGIEVLAGATTNNDYLVLKLVAPDNFYKALHKIEEESDTLKFPGGFKTHISLYTVPKNSLSLEILQKLNDLIVKGSMTLNHQITVKPQSVSVFNNSRLLELRQKLRQAVKKE